MFPKLSQRRHLEETNFLLFIFLILFCLNYFILYYYKMSSYWKNDGKIGVKQTQVSVPSTNGRSYSATAGSGGQRMDFEIPPSVKFLDGKNSYLQFDIKLSAGAIPTRLTLDPFIGGQSLVKNLRIMSGSRAVELESISDYNAKVQIQYSYNTDDSLKKMRALKEGCLVPSISTRGTMGTSVSNNIDLMSNPYFKPKLVNTADVNWGADDFVTAKVSLPIHSGIFADSSKIFPVLMTQGLFVSVDLEDPSRVIKQLDSVNRNRRLKQNPFFHGINAAGGALTRAATERTEIFLGKQNGVLTTKDCPFVVGERIGICSKDDAATQANLTIGQAAVTASGVLIKNIDVSGTFVRLTTEGFRNSLLAGQGGGVEVTSNNFVLYSTAVDTRRVKVDDGTQFVAPLTLYDAKYEISNAEIVCAKVECDPRYEEGMICKMREGGSIELDIHSCTNIKHSLLASNRQATVDLACSNTRVKSSIIMPTDATVYNTAELIGGLETTYDVENIAEMDNRLHSIRSGQTGIIDQLTSFQMFVDQSLQPRTPIVVSKMNKGVSIAAMPLCQLEKALNQAGIPAKSFAEYNRNFLIGHAYALDNGVANLNNISNQLQLQYNESSVAGVDRPSTKDKLLLAFIFHLRRITIKGDSVTVTL